MAAAVGRPNVGEAYEQTHQFTSGRPIMSGQGVAGGPSGRRIVAGCSRGCGVYSLDARQRPLHQHQSQIISAQFGA